MKKSRLESTNFLTSVLTLALTALGVWGINIDIDPAQAIQEILAKNLEYIITIAIPSVGNLIFKITQKIQDGTLSIKRLFKSLNFVTQAITVLAVILTSVGIMIPETAPQALSEAIFSGSIVTIITALVTNVLNPLWHFFFDKKETQP